MEMDRKPALYSDFFEMDTEAMELLGAFFEWLKAEDGEGLPPAKASPLAHDADRYLRDFLVEFMEARPKATSALLVFSYLGNWYPVNTLEPSHGEIDRIADALSRLHRYLAAKGIIAYAAGVEVVELLARSEIFHDRLESFWALTPDQVEGWREVGEYRKNYSKHTIN